MTSSTEQQKICFVIHPSGAEWRDAVEQTFEFIITEAVETFGYTPIRADQINDTGFISPWALQHLAQDALVIADLTGQSPQVLYGLALRHAARKPVIHLMSENDAGGLESSFTPMLRVNVSSAREAKRCRQELTNCIETIETSALPQETPISRALRRQVLEQSESLLDKRAADILRAMAGVQGTLTTLTERLNVPDNLLPPDYLLNTLKNSGTVVIREDLERMLGDTHGVIMGLSDRLSTPDNLLPPDYITNAIKNSGLLLNREEVEHMMTDVFTYAEEAKSILAEFGETLSSASKTLRTTGTALSDHETKPVDFSQVAAQVNQQAAEALQLRNAATDAAQKLDAVLNTLSLLYRSLSKATA
jgi:hypothetical protein